MTLFNVSNCSEVSHNGGYHKIHIHNPATGNPYAFPTEPQPSVRLGQRIGLNKAKVQVKNKKNMMASQTRKELPEWGGDEYASWRWD